MHAREACKRVSSSRLQRVVGGSARTFARFGRVAAGVSWIVTNRCNLRCVYCACPDMKVPELDTDQALDVIDEMAAMGTARVHLTGGEPLVRKDIEKLITRLRFHAIDVSVSSNGTLVPRRRRILRDCRSVSLSLDGPPAVHDLNRAEGQVDEVIAALAALQELGVTRYLTCLVTSRTGPACLDFVLGVAKRFEAEVFFQPALDIVLASDESNPVAAGPEQVRTIFDAVMSRKKAGAPVGNSLAGL
ncbi:MAG: MoaA/NifB/PqqE/SkfB family radical SAM enzyme, partial [Myxococcota bacterium]